MLCNSCFAVGNFLFAQFAEGIGLQAPTESCFASHENSISHSSINRLPPFVRSFSNIGWMNWLNKSTYLELSSVTLLRSLPILLSAYSKCTLTSMLSKVIEIFIYSFNSLTPLWFLCSCFAI